MTSVLHLRPTPDDLATLERIRRPGESVADVLRRGLRAAEALEAREAMRVESQRIATDPDDLREMAAVGEEMDALRAW